MLFFPAPYHHCVPGSSSSSSPSELSEAPASDGSSQASASGGSDQPDDTGARAATAVSSQTACAPKPDGAVTAAPATTATPRVNPISNAPLPPG